jgi:hypothetical protein
MIYRVTAGIFISILYLLVFTGTVDWFEGFNRSQKAIFAAETVSIVKATLGIIYIYLMAFASIYLIIFSEEGHKILIGFFLVPVVFGILLAFQ